MAVFVLEEVLPADVGLPALAALIGPLSLHVDFLVVHKVVVPVEGFVTLGTLVGPLPGVDPLVPDEVRGTGEALAAVWTQYERPLAAVGVHPFVHDEIPPLREVLHALPARVRPLHRRRLEFAQTRFVTQPLEPFGDTAGTVFCLASGLGLRGSRLA